jgi:hypothetical protein
VCPLPTPSFAIAILTSGVAGNFSMSGGKPLPTIEPGTQPPLNDPEESGTFASQA